MKCEEIQELIGAWEEGILSTEIGIRVERHLLRCPHCAYQKQSIEQARQILRTQIPPTETTPHFRERSLAKLMDHFSEHLRPVPSAQEARQWTLPLLKEGEA